MKERLPLKGIKLKGPKGGELLSKLHLPAFADSLMLILGYLIAAWYVNRGDTQWPEFAIPL